MTAILELMVACGYSRDNIKVVKIDNPDNKYLVHNGEKLLRALSKLAIGMCYVIPADRPPDKFKHRMSTFRANCSAFNIANTDKQVKLSFKKPYEYATIERIK